MASDELVRSGVRVATVLLQQWTTVQGRVARGTLLTGRSSRGVGTRSRRRSIRKGCSMAPVATAGRGGQLEGGGHRSAVCVCVRVVCVRVLCCPSSALLLRAHGSA